MRNPLRWVAHPGTLQKDSSASSGGNIVQTAELKLAKARVGKIYNKKNPQFVHHADPVDKRDFSRGLAPSGGGGDSY